MTNGKRVLAISLAGVVAISIGGSIIVSSQEKQARVEISSRSGLKDKPENLKIPQSVQNKEVQNQERGKQSIPVDVTYRQIFKHIAELNRKADSEERKKNKSGKNLRGLYRKMARLNENQAKTLDQIAKKTNRELEKLDERAKRIVKNIRSQTPNRRIEYGQKIPVPPQELIDLAKQRKELTLNAVRELEKDFGMPGFVRFTKFINEKIKPGIKRKGNGTVIQRGGRTQ